MFSSVVIGKFYNTKSDIHTLNPLGKLIDLLLLILSFIWLNNIYIIIMLFTFELIIFLVTNIPFKIIGKSIFSLKYLLIFIVLINLFMGNTYLSIGVLLFKVIGILIYSNIFILTTTSKDILRAFNALLSPLHYVGLKTEIVSFIITLAIRFIPITMEEAERILNSLKCKGLSNDSGIKEKVLGLKSLMIPMYLSSFRKADSLSDMMELRLYNVNNQKRERNMKWNYLDGLLLFIHVIILVVVLKEVVL